MQKIIIIGSPGAGKSTFAKHLSKLTNIPLYHLDMLLYRKDRSELSKVEFDRKLDEILKKDKWIIDGNYQRTLSWRLEECDTVYLLDYPTTVCLHGAISRIGKIRDDFPWIEDKFDEKFKNSILNFSKDKLPEIYELLRKYQGTKSIIIFKSREEATSYLETLMNDKI